MIIKENWHEPLSSWRLWAPPTAMSIFLVVVAQYNFLTFHTLAELFAIVISFVMFAFAWSTRDFSRNNFLLFLACGYFWIGSLDLMHTLVYKGMNIFIEGSGNLSVQFWIGTRYSEALLLLAAPFAAARKQNGYLLIIIFGAVAGVLTTSVLSGYFPTGFVEGTGLTNFKIYSEYLIILILAIAFIAMFRQGRDIKMEEKALIASSIIITICAELAFTFYVSVYGLSNLAGHIFKLYSFWLIFNAIVVYNLQAPYNKLRESRNRAEEQEATLNAIFNGILDGVIFTDSARCIVEANRAMEKIFGYTKDELIGKQTVILYECEEEYERQGRIRFNSRAEKMPEPYEVNYRCKDGQVFVGETLGTSIKGASGEVLGFIGVIRDITERKNTEKHVLEVRVEAEKANRAKSEFLASMSHELRTPLNAVIGFSQMLQLDSRNPLTQAQSEHVKSILSGGEHLLELVNEILDLAKIEADHISLTLGKVNANEVVADCIALSIPLGRPTGIKFIDQISSRPSAFLRTDRLRLKQILINLLSNAVKYNKNRGTITVDGWETEGGFFRICVTDTGIGIAEENFSVIFEKFNCLELNAAVAREGTGIGLTVTKLLIDRMAGRIGVESELGVGSTFWIELPLVSNEEVLIWADSLRIGVDAIDKDHQVLTSLLNRVTQCSIDDADLDTVIEELIAYTSDHFKREEVVMEACGYPDLENHRELHRDLTAQVSDLAEVWFKDRDLEILHQFRKLLRDWLFDHIMKDDARIAPYTKGKGQYIRKALEDIR